MDTLTTDRATQIDRVLESIITFSRALARPRMTPFGDAVLTRTQLEILFVLAHATEPVAPGRLAATVNVTPGAITQTMDQLRDQHLVEQSPSDLDGRVRVWRLTDSTATQVAAFEAATILRTTPWFISLSPDELETLAALISRVEVA
ncbi:MarR family winged helix-turn-helix transcriptional regulator [Cryobacterium sp. PH31-L1]|uniref:MarR family winged helix-turn-helix transcriptional regulator n=1 Tax=Cryobacterium sp. PH31-L1 TaxID=3046199 RepID=UPI0024BAE538|nr:MarR family winged helix-turn-helix transcriptional regulator [Cryobacterium sp. PH31-L1]MDJ0377994.1 MarR family winged helix-turn-helix transcriptional regulator [Cryobacterium sp. PH31-L1]